MAVLDVMMPEMNGFEVARRARNKGIKTPILMLTAKSQLDDKVEGLDSGADDYLTKPFQTKELLARLRALGRRSASFQDGSLKYGDLSLDTSKATLTCISNGQSVRLGEKELHILEYMFGNKGDIFQNESLRILACLSMRSNAPVEHCVAERISQTFYIKQPYSFSVNRIKNTAKRGGLPDHLCIFLIFIFQRLDLYSPE